MTSEIVIRNTRNAFNQLIMKSSNVVPTAEEIAAAVQTQYTVSVMGGVSATAVITDDGVVEKSALELPIGGAQEIVGFLARAGVNVPENLLAQILTAHPEYHSFEPFIIKFGATTRNGKTAHTYKDKRVTGISAEALAYTANLAKTFKVILLPYQDM